MLVIVDGTTLTVEVTGRGVKFRLEDVLEIDVEVDDEVFDAAEEEVRADVVVVPLEETVVEAVSVVRVRVGSEVKDEVCVASKSNPGL